MDHNVPIREHLLELRKRLFYSSIAVITTTAVAFVFHEQILILLMKPAQGFVDVPGEKPIFTDLTEFISTAMKASLLVGVFSSLPFILYQMVAFVAPGLKPAEKRYLYALLPITVIVFLIGAVFGYLVLFPPAIAFLLSFGADVATPYIRIGNYASIMISLLFWMGLVFETPVVLFFLTKIGVVSPTFLTKNRRWAVVIAFILGALITPTFDPINQTIVALPIIVLYELGIWLSKAGARSKKKDEKQTS